jgi:hypothetical protein
VKLLIGCAIALTFLSPTVSYAQEPPAVPSSATEPQGFIPEPDPITRATLFADRQLGKGDLTNGIYWDYGNMIPGAGWGSIGPGYRHWYGKDSIYVDASAAISVHNYKIGQARFELPKFLKSRLALGAQARWQDFGRVDFFGVGNDTTSDMRSIYGVKSTQLTAYASLRPFRWMDIDAQIGWMNPRVRHTEGSLLIGVDEQRTFVPTEVSMTIDTRDFPGHPTSGVVLRGARARYDDRTSGTNTFRRYEAEAAGFIPIAGSRVVLGLHGWLVRSDVEAGQSMPFYLQPSLGGVNTLRSYTDYRYHDNNLALATAELRFALMTHVDLAVFTDAGNVARRERDLDFDKQSYGAGFRLHTRRETFALLDVARGDEGWRVLFRLKDPLALARLNRRSTLVPFVP